MKKLFFREEISYGFSGDFEKWTDVIYICNSHKAEVIQKKVDIIRDSLLEVKNGNAAFERDGFLFKEIEYSWPLLAGFFWIASQNSNKLNVVDYGGSLGTTYFQHKFFFKCLDKITWSVVEQKEYVDCGLEFFEDNELKFYYDLNSCLSVQKPQLILLSGVLQYLEEPYIFIDSIMERDFEYIILDRTPFSKNDRETIRVQKISLKSDEVIYPCWFFSLPKIMDIILNRYQLIAEFDPIDGGDADSVYKGFIFRILRKRTKLKKSR